MGQASLCEPADVFTRAPPVRGKDVVDTVFGVELGKPFLSNVAVRDAVCVGHEVANGHGPDQGRMHACGIIPEGVQHLNIREFRKVKGHRVPVDRVPRGSWLPRLWWPWSSNRCGTGRPCPWAPRCVGP